MSEDTVNRTAVVRAKFKVTKIERSMGSIPTVEEGQTRWSTGEVWTVHMNPVHGNSNPEHENSKFWNATPSGSLILGCVSKAAVDQLELDKEYYLDFIPAK